MGSSRDRWAIWQGLAAGWREYWPNVLSIAGGLLVAALQLDSLWMVQDTAGGASNWLDGYTTIIWEVRRGVVLAGVGLVSWLTGQAAEIGRKLSSASVRRELECLRSDLAAADAERLQLWQASAEDLYRALRRFDLGRKSKNTEYRLSVYRENGAEFVRASRYCPNPALEAGGRDAIPAGEGCLWLAWTRTSGVFFRDNLPDPGTQPAEYEAQQAAACALPAATGAACRMKSRWYAAYRLVSADRRVGVLVIESTDPEWMSERAVTSKARYELDHIATLASRVALERRDPRPAAERGL